MKIKTNIYTSYYARMLQRHKVEGRDWYIQISRTLFYPYEGVDKKTMNQMIDFNYGDTFGNFASSLKQYEKEIKSGDFDEYLDDLRDLLTGKKFAKDYSKEDKEAFEEVIDDLKEWKKSVAKLSAEERIKAFREEYKTQEDKDAIAGFGLTESVLGEKFSKWEPMLTFDFYILCFENLESKYTKKDEEKYSDCKAGTYKKCHRTNLAKVLAERYGLKISEYGVAQKELIF